jgi:hypothetical protein
MIHPEIVPVAFTLPIKEAFPARGNLGSAPSAPG